MGARNSHPLRKHQKPPKKKKMTHNKRKNTKVDTIGGRNRIGWTWCASVGDHLIKQRRRPCLLLCLLCICECVRFGLGRQLFCLIPTGPCLLVQVRWHKESFLFVMIPVPIYYSNGDKTRKEKRTRLWHELITTPKKNKKHLILFSCAVLSHNTLM